MTSGPLRMHYAQSGTSRRWRFIPSPAQTSNATDGSKSRIRERHSQLALDAYFQIRNENPINSTIMLLSEKSCVTPHQHTHSLLHLFRENATMTVTILGSHPGIAERRTVSLLLATSHRVKKNMHEVHKTTAISSRGLSRGGDDLLTEYCQ